MNHGRSCFSSLRALALAGALVALSLSAHAVTWKSNTDFLWNAGTGNITAFPGQGAGNIWAQGSKAPLSTGPQWTGPAKQLPFNPSPTVNFKAKFTPGNLAKGLFNPANLAPIIIGGALQTLLSEACTRIAGGTMQIASGGQWEECNFVTEQQQQVRYSHPDGGATKYETPELLFEGIKTVQGWHCNETFISYNGPRTGSGGGLMYYSYVGGSGCGSGGTTNKYINESIVTATVQRRDGWKPATNARAEELVTSRMNDWTQADFLYGYQARPGKNLSEVLDTIINSGNGVDIDPGTVSVTGPASMPGVPVTEQVRNPDGTTTTKTTNITNNYNYGSPTTDNRITITNTTTQTTNTTIVNNTTNETLQTSTQTITKDSEPDKAECEKSPDTIGCARFGTPEAGTPITKDTKNITITPASFAGGSCPGPINFSAFNRSYAFSYDTLCGKLAGLQPLFMALAALVAAWILADSFKVS